MTVTLATLDGGKDVDSGAKFQIWGLSPRCTHQKLVTTEIVVVVAGERTAGYFLGSAMGIYL